MTSGLPRFEYFDHDADTGVIGRGETLEQAFTHAAEATFALMCDPMRVALKERFDVEFDEDDRELALAIWLNLLLAQANTRGLAMARFELNRQHAHWRGTGWGEAWHAGLERGTQVKGATLTALQVTESATGWEARCVVDV
jgi:SHS2 domain-containing protein